MTIEKMKQAEDLQKQKTMIEQRINNLNNIINPEHPDKNRQWLTSIQINVSNGNYNDHFVLLKADSSRMPVLIESFLISTLAEYRARLAEIEKEFAAL